MEKKYSKYPYSETQELLGIFPDFCGNYWTPRNVGNIHPKYIYIASAMAKGNITDNLHSSFKVADRLLKLGFIPFAPGWTYLWDFCSPKDWDEWLKFDFEWIKRCDALLRLEGESSGADKEVLFAKENNIPIYFNVEDLIKTLPSGKR